MKGFKQINTFTHSLRVKQLNQLDVMKTLVPSHPYINLSNNAPSSKCPQFLRDYLAEESISASLQYTMTAGVASLLESIGKFYEPHIRRKINPQTDIVITPGSASILNCCILGLVNPGEEVLVFDPSQENYVNSINYCGAKYVGIPLQPVRNNSVEELRQRGPNFEFDPQFDEWQVDYEKLEQTISEKTKLIIINSPHSPTGKVFTYQEIQRILTIAKKNPNIVILFDESNSEVCFDPHGPFSIPRPFDNLDYSERTILIQDVASLFSAPALGIACAIGNATLITAIRSVNQYTHFCLNEPFQKAIGRSLDICSQNDYFQQKCNLYKQQRNALLQSLLQSNIETWVPQGGSYLLSRINRSQIPQEFLSAQDNHINSDIAFVKWMASSGGVLTYPVSLLCSEQNQQLGNHFVRWSFSKSMDDILKAGEQIEKIFIQI